MSEIGNAVRRIAELETKVDWLKSELSVKVASVVTRQNLIWELEAQNAALEQRVERLRHGLVNLAGFVWSNDVGCGHHKRLTDLLAADDQAAKHERKNLRKYAASQKEES